MKAKFEWQIAIVNEVAGLSPIELFEMYCKVCEPDDFEGSFTPKGGWECKYVEEAMRNTIKTLSEK